MSKRKLRVASRFDARHSIILENGNALDVLKRLPAGLAKLVLTSPPYNVGKTYEKKTSLDAYLSTVAEICSEIKRVLHPAGSVCWQVGNHVRKGEVFPLDIYFYPIFKSLGFQLRNRIVWHFDHGLHNKQRFSGRYETLLWFTKGEKYKFNLDSVRVPAKYPGKRHYKPGPNYGKPSGNPLGKNPGDIWKLLRDDWGNGLWDIPNVKASHPEKTLHECQFPIELVERCVLALTDPGEWVLDPFAGVGSTIVGALKCGRRAIGIDREARYLTIAKHRIALLQSGKLPYRPLGKPVLKPNGREKVARVPKEWATQSQTP